MTQSKKRQYRTPGERIAAAKAEAAALEARVLKEAADLYVKAVGWEERSAELLRKSGEAKTKSFDMIGELGLDPATEIGNLLPADLQGR